MKAIEGTSWLYDYQDDENWCECLLGFLIELSDRDIDLAKEKDIPVKFTNKTEFDSPMLITNRDVLIVSTNVKGNYWCQFIYQLSHELMHLYIRLKYKYEGEKCALSWVEETICEAYSLYMLDIASNEWFLCSLSTYSPEYSESIYQYLKNEINTISPAGSIGTSDSTYDDFMKSLNEKSEDMDGRKYRKPWRNKLYEVMLQHPNEIPGIMKYGQYINVDNSVALNCNRWINDDPDNALVRCIVEIQLEIEREFKQR